MVSATRPALRLQLVGPLRLLSMETAEPVPIPKGRATTLFVVLAVHRGQLVGLDDIVAALWPSGGTTNAPQIVASLVSRLRRPLGSSLEHLDGGYRLDTRGWEVDVDDAERLVRSAERDLAAAEPGLSHAAARRAIELLGVGRPLEAHRSLTVVDDLDPVIDALLRRARGVAWASALALGDAESARREAAEATAADPLDEEAQRALMQALCDLGERNAALHTYSRLQRILRQDLGADPDPQTQSLHLRILRGEGGRASDRGTRPDRCGRRFEAVASSAGTQVVGRDDVLAEFADAWRSVVRGESAVLTLLGGAGCGKSEALRAGANHVTATGGVVLDAHCSRYERVTMMQPLVAAIRRFCAGEHPDRVRDLARGLEPALVELIPALADVLSPAVAPHPAPSYGHAVEAVQVFLLNVARRQPLMIAVDDAHVADDGTITVLHRLRASNAPRMLLAVTAQDGDADALSAALGATSRRLFLKPLTAHDVAELARRWRVPAAAGEVYALTGGVPGLVVETLRAVAGGADPDHLVPPLPILRDAALEHLRAAGDAAVRLLALVAVFGRRFRFEDLVRLGFPLPDAVAATQRALRLGLLLVDGDALVFASGLVHAAALASVPEPIRRNVERCLPVAVDRSAPSAVVDLRRGRGRSPIDGLDPAS
ncbi:BTAD domain-containing putative transcriptional regulator [Nocardioides panacihumi]